MAVGAATVAWQTMLFVSSQSENALRIDPTAPSKSVVKQRHDFVLTLHRYVQLLEDQQMKLVEGVQELYRRLRRGEGWTGPNIAEDSQGYPLVQDVLDALSVLAPSERRPARNNEDTKTITELDEEEDMSNQQDRSVRLGSTSPPPTPPDYSQSSATSSPREEYARDRSATMFVAKSYPQLTTKPMPVAAPACPSTQVLACQPLIADSSEYWPTNSTFGGSVGHADFPDLIDPFQGGHNVHNEVNWYPGSYTMM